MVIICAHTIYTGQMKSAPYIIIALLVLLGSICYTKPTIVEGFSTKTTFNEYDPEQDDLQVKLWNLSKRDNGIYDGEELPSQKNGNINPRDTQHAYTKLFDENEWRRDKKNKVQFVRISRNGGNRKFEYLNWWSGQGKEPGGWYIFGSDSGYNSRDELMRNVYGKGSHIGDINNTINNNRNNFNIDVPDQYHNSRYIYLYLDDHYSYGGWLYRISAKGGENLQKCEYGSWGECSKPCGGGTQTRTLNTNNCDENGQSSGETRDCNTQACEYKTGQWSACEPECGNNRKKTRSVECTDGNGNNINKEHCNSLTTPADSADCITQYCEFNTGMWNQCSQDCGGGTQSRTVTCVNKNGDLIGEQYCNVGNKPSNEQPCNTQACPQPVIQAPVIQASRRGGNQDVTTSVQEVTTPVQVVTNEQSCDFTLEDNKKIKDRADNGMETTTSEDRGNGLKTYNFYRIHKTVNGKEIRVPPSKLDQECSNAGLIKEEGHKFPKETEVNYLARRAGLSDEERNPLSYKDEYNKYKDEYNKYKDFPKPSEWWKSQNDMFDGLKLDTAETCYKRSPTGAFIKEEPCSKDVGPIAANEVLGDTFLT